MPLESRPVAAQRILVNTSATLTSYKLDQYGEVADPDLTTVTITRADDTVVDTDAATTEDVLTHQVSYTLPAGSNTQLDWLKAVWTDTDGTSWTTYHEVVGGFYASVAEIRARDPNLADSARYPTTTIRALLEEVESALEEETGRAFVPRYRRARLNGTAKKWMLLPDADIRSIRSGREYSDYQTYTSFTATDLANLDWYPSGALERIDGTWWYSGLDYVIEYEYGTDRPPADMKAAAIRWLRNTLNASKSGIPDRATSFSVADGGSYQLITPGLNGAVSGIPEVDVVIERYRMRRFTIGV